MRHPIYWQNNCIYQHYHHRYYQHLQQHFVLLVRIPLIFSHTLITFVRSTRQYTVSTQSSPFLLVGQCCSVCRSPSGSIVYAISVLLGWFARVYIYIYIYIINKYILVFYIYLIRWKLVFDRRFHDVLYIYILREREWETETEREREQM